jgi:Domain of unknown function (DUF1995)
MAAQGNIIDTGRRRPIRRVVDLGMNTASSSTMVLMISILFLGIASALIPSSPQEQTRRAIKSIKNAIERHKTEQLQQLLLQQPPPGGRPCRLYVDYLIPLPPETVAADIDPWPGGLAQMYPYAEAICQEILKGIVMDDGPSSSSSSSSGSSCSSQVLDASDCCGLLIQESKISAKEDVAALLFPGVDQLDLMEQVDAMVGPERTLLIFNKQFQRVSDFGGMTNLLLWGGRGTNNPKQVKAQRVIFDSFVQGFAFQEFACRGEDTKLLYEAPLGWTACVICDENVEVGAREIELMSSQPNRPTYDVLEAKINQVLPEPLWMRKMGEAEEKGFKFQR